MNYLLTESAPPQIFVKAAWRGDGRNVAAFIGGNLDAEPREVQRQVLLAAMAAVRSEASRLGFNVEPETMD